MSAARPRCGNCLAAGRCGTSPNFCSPGPSRPDVSSALIAQLDGLDFRWPRVVRHADVRALPFHLPVLVQAYADPVDVPWVALHGGRLFGVAGRGITPKHRQPLRQVYRLAPTTKLALELYVEDRVLEGLWANRQAIVRDLIPLGFDLILTPNFSVWRDACRFEQLLQERRAFIFYHELREAGLPAIPDVGFSRFEPDGRLWAEWVNSQSDLRAISLFCGGRKIHAERRAHAESVEDIALLHQAVRADVTFVLGGVHAPRRLADYRRVTRGRQLAICNGMAYALAQRRRLLDRGGCNAVARSARDCFLRNCAWNERTYAAILWETGPVAV